MTHTEGPVLKGLCPERCFFQLCYVRGALLGSVVSCLGLQLASEVPLGVPVAYQLGKLLGKKKKKTQTC